MPKVSSVRTYLSIAHLGEIVCPRMSGAYILTIIRFGDGTPGIQVALDKIIKMFSSVGLTN
jgi:hypothetical protein